jgi:hypothetical protein
MISKSRTSNFQRTFRRILQNIFYNMVRTNQNKNLHNISLRMKYLGKGKNLEDLQLRKSVFPVDRLDV